MTVELTAFSTYLAEGVELVENKPTIMREGADLLVRLFDNQKLTGNVLRATGAHALIKIGENVWWLKRTQRGGMGRWVVEVGGEPQRGTTG